MPIIHSDLLPSSPPKQNPPTRYLAIKAPFYKTCPTAPSKKSNVYTMLLFLAILLVCMPLTLALTLPRLPPHDDFQYTSPITIGRAAFETYTANPKLFITLPPTTTPSTSESGPEPTYAGYDDDVKEGDEDQRPHRPVFQVTKSQVEDVLRKTLHLDFRLQVVSSANKGKDDKREILGEIPVQITIHSLRLGGLSAPRVHSQSWNEQHDPVNYGNIPLTEPVQHVGK
ncbi:hypothetical protein BGZ97_008241 [Linnemannia gamsii]|uniref:Uncharacterized protein n=1 Tax=Linnemannia gamsii TaxID=64522 RepID=A0A9P6UEP9_9FUNG|nr:hypothetical protein BGZ97_008241 [Linnemannia gamsii]